LIPILEKLAVVEDVRDPLRKFVINDRVDFKKAREFINSEESRKI
jgi:hypothetical protein